MAKPYIEISKTEFNKNYNVVKVLVNKQEIMDFVKTQYKESNNQAVAFGIKKKPKVTLEDVMNEIKSVKADVKSINDRIDNLVSKNNLIE